MADIEHKQKLIEDILAHMENMPQVPVVAMQVNRLLDDPDTNAKDLARIIMRDPSLTTKVLRLCNSAEYGFARRIGTISEAVSILGYHELKKIIFIIISHTFLNRPLEGYALEGGALWENALTCAVYAKHIAEKIGYKNTEQVFVAALLRDLGKVALESYVHCLTDEIEETALTHRISYSKAEEQVIGVSHTEIGKLIAQKFNLPDHLVSIIAYHHHPSQMPPETSREDRMLVSLVHLADAFTMMTGHGTGVDGLMYPLEAEALKILNIPADSDMLETLYAEILDLAESIDVMNSTMDSVASKK